MRELTKGGGAKQRRGALYQDRSLLFYILTRLIDHPDLEAAIESVEDATIFYSIKEEETTKQIVEFVQCKKRETASGGSQHAGFNDDDPWIAGQFNIDDLKKWVLIEREGNLTVRLLDENPNSFYTVLAFGNLQNKLIGFVPEELRNFLPVRHFSSKLRREFPVAYCHKKDPINVPKNRFSSEGVRKRIRIISTGSPKELERDCIILLLEEELYRVSAHKVDSIMNKLQGMITDRSTIEGRILGREILEIILAGRKERGLWQVGGDLLRRDYQGLSDPNKGESANWIDFEQGRFADRTEFNIAWNEIRDEGAFVAVNGAVGTGKTTLCRYLLYKFLKANPNNRAYYLTVLPTTPLTDELEFLSQNIRSNTLFIIDDEHLAVREVAAVIEAFTDFKASGNAKARLVVSSKINYGRTEGLAQGHMAKELRQALHIPLPNNSVELVAKLLSDLRRKAGLVSSLTDKELASLSDGVLGIALLIARATRELKGDSGRGGILTKSSLKGSLARWVLSYLPQLKNPHDFESQVAPIFVISAFGLPIPGDYSQLVKPLCDAGFLERFEAGDDSPLHRVTNTNLAFIFQEQYKSTHLKMLNDYIERYPQWLAHTLTRVADWKESEQILEKLCRQNLDLILRVITDKTSGSTLREITNILRAIRSVARGLSTMIYQRWVLPNYERNKWFFSDVIAKARNASELTAFINLVHEIDYRIGELKALAESQLMHYEAEAILSLFMQESCRIDQVAACLHAIKNCSESFAKQLYERLKESGEFEERIDKTELDERGLSILLRYCAEIKAINRAESYASLEKYLPPRKIIDTVLLKIDTLNPIALFILRLHRLYPRWAAEIVSTLWNEYEERFAALLRREKDLDTLCQDIYSLSRVNRLIAIRITLKMFDHLVHLLQNEDKYPIVGAKIETIRKHVSLSIASELCDSVDKQRVLRSVQNERRYIDIIGKFLYFLTQSSADTAAWFEERLDYQSFFRVARAPKLRDVALVIRGFLTAASIDRIVAARKKMLDDVSLISLLRKRWEEANTLSEVGFCLTALTDSPLQKPHIERLLNFNNLSELSRDINTRFERASDILHIANGLYGVARFDRGIAKQSLRLYVDKVDPRTKIRRDGGRQEEIKEQPQNDSEFGRNKNLVELGCLFHIASAINSGDARRLAELINPTALARVGVDEANLGRLTVFISGMLAASKRCAKAVVSEICSEDQWRKQLERNEEFEPLVHYIRALTKVDTSKSAHFIGFLFRYYKEEINAYLRIQADTLLISNWIRILSDTKAETIEGYADISDEFAKLLQEASKYDTRLRNLLESTEALIEVGNLEAAKEFSKNALRQAKQMTSVRRLQDWIVMANKALHIESKFPGFTADLIKHLEGKDITVMIESENRAILSAFTHYMFTHNPALSASPLRHAVGETRDEIILAATKGSDSVIKTLSLILLQMPARDIIETLENINWEQSQAWELGLIALLYKMLQPDHGLGLPLPFPIESTEWKEFLNSGLNGHAGNLEFALTLYLAQYANMAEATMADWRDQALSRAETEASSPIKWLLNPDRNVKGLVRLSYYVWSYLKEGVLRPTYFPWENDIEVGADSIAFGHNYLRDLSALITT